MSKGSSTMSSDKKKLALALVVANPKTSPKTAANLLMTSKVAHLNEAYMKQKTLRKIKAEHATLYLCNLEEFWTNDVSKLLHELNTSQDKKFVRLRQIIKHGDLLEDVSSDSIYFFDRSKHTIITLVPMAKETFLPDNIEFITQIHNPYYYLDENNNSKWHTSRLSFDGSRESQINGFPTIIHIPKKKLQKYSSLITEDDIEKHHAKTTWISEIFSDGSTNKFKIEYKGLTYFIEANIDSVNLSDKASKNDWHFDLQYEAIEIFGTYDADIVGGKPKPKPKPKPKSK
jgi:hypothetical protein